MFVKWLNYLPATDCGGVYVVNKVLFLIKHNVTTIMISNKILNKNTKVKNELEKKLQNFR